MMTLREIKATTEAVCAVRYPACAVEVFQSKIDPGVDVFMTSPDGDAEASLPDDPRQWTIARVAAVVDECAAALAKVED
jgi:hypothetical protein